MTGRTRSCCLVVGILAVAALVIVGGLGLGARPLGPDAVARALLFPDGRLESILVWTLRLPRSLAAFAAGVGLAVAGHLLQVVTRNPLAGPGLTGVTAGAVAPIVFCFLFVPKLSPALHPFIGMAGGLAAAGFTMCIARGGHGRPLHLALGGISISLFLTALTTYLLLLSGSQAPSLLFWLSGGLQGRSWPQLVFMLPWVVAAIVGALVCRRIVGMMALDEVTAAGMGLRTGFWKPVLLVLSVLPVAGIAPVAGPIAFVGLASPHIARLLRPAGDGWMIALSASIGGLVVTVADLVGRSVAPPQEIPIGIVTALLGGPVFIFLAQQRRAVAGTT